MTKKEKSGAQNQWWHGGQQVPSSSPLSAQAVPNQLAALVASRFNREARSARWSTHP